METTKLYYEDAYLREFDAAVLSCREEQGRYLVVLDRTAFYPEGGGQPADHGVLGGVAVTDVQERNGVVCHTCAGPLAVGSTVHGAIDWQRRFDHMQQHSGEHILSGLLCSLYHCDNVGFHMGKDAILIDFNTKIPAEDLPVLERTANEAIWRNVASQVTYPSKEELEKLEYRSKKALEGKVRIMAIGEYDCCACCGTHVQKAGEIGMVKILSAQNYKGGTRLEIVCGMRALADYDEKTENAAAISEMLSVPTGKIAKATEALLKERDELKQIISRMKWEKINNIAEKVGEIPKACVFAADFDSKDMVHLADTILDKTGGTAAVFAPAGTGYAFVLMSRTEDMRPMAAEMKEAFGSKGGGKPEAVQGRTEAKEKELKGFFAEKGYVMF